MPLMQVIDRGINEDSGILKHRVVKEILAPFLRLKPPLLRPLASMDHREHWTRGVREIRHAAVPNPHISHNEVTAFRTHALHRPLRFVFGNHLLCQLSILRVRAGIFVCPEPHLRRTVRFVNVNERDIDDDIVRWWHGFEVRPELIVSA